MDPAWTRSLLLGGGLVTGYLVLMLSQPTRASFRDGWRCVVRYKRLFVIPLVFAAFHVAFTLWVRFDESRTIAGAPPFIVPWAGWHPEVWREVLQNSWLPALESVASIFNCAVTTFPLSALWGLLFLGNWRGYQMTLGRGLRSRFGMVIGVLAHAGIVVCAAAACVKPVLFAKFSWLGTMADERVLIWAGEGINWLSFLFEYLIGVGVQIYLLLLAFTWVRGLTFDFERLRRFSLQRWLLVLQWAGVLLVISSVGINLPLVLASLPAGHALDPALGARAIAFTRWFLAACLIVFCSVQILLVFHNGTLWRAFREHVQLLRRHGWHLGWFIVIATVHYLALAAANAVLPRTFGEWTWPSLCWKATFFPLLWSVLSAWLLASWVCLFRRCEADAPEANDLVRF